MPAFVYMFFGTSAHLGLAPSALLALLTGATAREFCEKRPTPVDSWYAGCTLVEYE